MTTFDYTRIPNKNLSHRKFIYGIGINDANYQTHQIVNGKKTMCPFYQKWNSMLKRCYSNKCLAKQPTYVGCSVSKEWLTFSNFKLWMEQQNWKNKHLDKDLLTIGNKIYSAKTCLFVSSTINNLLSTHANARGKFPQGVSFNKSNNKYKAQIRIIGKVIHLGYFITIKEAEIVYIKEKIKYVNEIALQQTEPLKQALINWCQIKKEEIQ